MRAHPQRSSYRSSEKPSKSRLTAAGRATIRSMSFFRHVCDASEPAGRSGLEGFAADGDRWRRYGPSSDGKCVIVQASTASLFARVAVALDDEQLLGVADDQIQTVLVSQRAAGSWPYSCYGCAIFVDAATT